MTTNHIRSDILCLETPLGARYARVPDLLVNCLLGPEVRCNVEVCEMNMPFRVEQDIVWLDISVYYALAVDVS